MLHRQPVTVENRFIQQAALGCSDLVRGSLAPAALHPPSLSAEDLADG